MKRSIARKTPNPLCRGEVDHRFGRLLRDRDRRLGRGELRLAQVSRRMFRCFGVLESLGRLVELQTGVRLRLQTPAIPLAEHQRAAKQELMEAVAAELFVQAKGTDTGEQNSRQGCQGSPDPTASPMERRPC